jgi:two-component system, OmpR family, sensor kinase
LPDPASPRRNEPAHAACRRELGELLDDLVHELRTPLTVIAGYAALAAEEGEALDPLIRQSVTAIDQQSGRLSDQLEVLLEMARLWSGKRALEQRRFDLAALGRNLANTHDVESDVPLPAYVRGDKGLVGEACQVLLDNALAFGAPPVCVRVGREQGQAKLMVEDHGSGVPPEFVPLIGRRPFRGGAEDDEREGTGCRLLLVAAIAEAHGGGLYYSREAGVTRFTLTLPPAGERRAGAER